MKNAIMVIPSPFVYWAQTEKAISLKIDLKGVDKPNIIVLEDKVKFSAEGIGAHGQMHYEFSLDLFSSVKNNSSDDEQQITVRVLDNRVDIVIQKEKPAWWPRVTAQPQKPAWLKINFDLWKSEDAQDSEDEEKRDVLTDYPGMYDKLQKEEMGYRREEIIKVYLIIYNLFQFVGFTYVLSVIGMQYAKSGYDSITDTYQNVGSAMMFLHLMMYLEAMHPLFGYTRGGAKIPFLQVSGRLFVLFANIEAEPRMQTKPVVFYLFVIWSLVEVVRYPFYITQLYKKDIGILTWLRYSIWIILYPLGFLCESVVILRNIPYFEETQKFTVSLPNSWNFAFNMPIFMRFYLVFLVATGLYLMKHMYKLRTNKLKPKIVIRKCK